MAGEPVILETSFILLLAETLRVSDDYDHIEESPRVGRDSRPDLLAFKGPDVTVIEARTKPRVTIEALHARPSSCGNTKGPVRSAYGKPVAARPGVAYYRSESRSLESARPEDPC